MWDSLVSHRPLVQEVFQGPFKHWQHQPLPCLHPYMHTFSVPGALLHSEPQVCTKDKHAFVTKIFSASGISYTGTAIPACLQPTLTDAPKTDLNNAQQECKLVYGQVITDVLQKTGEYLRCIASEAGQMLTEDTCCCGASFPQLKCNGHCFCAAFYSGCSSGCVEPAGQQAQRCTQTQQLCRLMQGCNRAEQLHSQVHKVAGQLDSVHASSRECMAEAPPPAGSEPVPSDWASKQRVF